MPQPRVRYASSTLYLILLALIGVSVTGCDDDGPVGHANVLDPALVIGAYAAEGSDGAFTTTSTEEMTDWLAEGASIVIDLDEDGSTTGHLYIPAVQDDDSDFEADLTGAWAIQGDAVVFSHDADTFVRNMPFQLRDGRLEGELISAGMHVSVVLVPR